MKKLLIKIAGLIIIVAALNTVINHLFYNKKLPYYWGNINTLDKRNFIVKNHTKFNTLFIGSSKLHYQLNPVLFDSIVNSVDTGKDKIRSYNFGVDGMMPPESLYIYKSLLEKDSLSFKTAIIELNFLPAIETKNMFTWRRYYWLNKDTYHEYTSSLLASKYSFPLKVWNLSLLDVLAIQKLYNIGKFNEYVEFKKDEFLPDTSKEATLLGFKPLHHPKSFSAQEIQKMQDVKSASIIADDNYNKWSDESENKIYAAYLNQIVVLSQKKGIRVIFLLPTQWNVKQYRELFPILDNIPERDKILVFNYKDHQPLFDPQNLFDNSHVDSAGARIYTGYVARGFMKIRYKH
jgi:hypothetical protein